MIAKVHFLLNFSVCKASNIGKPLKNTCKGVLSSKDGGFMPATF